MTFADNFNLEKEATNQQIVSPGKNVKDMILAAGNHHGNLEFSCKLCFFSSNRKDTVKRHLILVHTENQQATCPHCYKKYKNSYTLKCHMHRNHRNQGNK